MSATDLLAECQARDIDLRAHGGQLDIDAPAGVVSTELLQRLRDAKPELLRILTSPATPSTIDREIQRVFTIAVDSPAAIADFCLLLTVDDFPPVPFQLNPWTEVRNAGKMLEYLRSRILRGLSGPKVQLDAMQADLRAIKRFVMHAAENNSAKSNA